MWFRKAEQKINFQLVQNQFARPQILAIIQGEDEEVMGEYIKENASLLIRSFQENERLEKIRRIKKSITKDEDLTEKFGIKLKYQPPIKRLKTPLILFGLKSPFKRGA